MPNAVNTNIYQNRVKEVMSLFTQENYDEKEVMEFVGRTGKYRIDINRYVGSTGKYNLKGSACSFFNNNILLKTWYCIDNSAEFYRLITHKNGKDYLLFRQDLYGYSVLDIETTQIMHFFPDYSLNTGETFIWADVYYNPINNILAVCGCYWACPNSVQLFTFDDPISEVPTFIDIISCLDGDYDVYDEIDFIKWKDGDLHIRLTLVENGTIESLIIPQEKYTAWLCDKTVAKNL